MGSSPRISRSSAILAIALGGWATVLGAAPASAAPADTTPADTTPADPPATNAGAATSTAPAPAPAPQESIFSSLKQAFRQDYDNQVVRGHFDVGSPPDVHRYYCLVDAKTGQRQPNGVPGQPVPRADGMTGIKATAVSIFSCASAEQQGSLVTAGYELRGGAAAGAVTAATVTHSLRATPPTPLAPTSTAQQPAAEPAREVPPYAVDVAGVRLGMSVDEVRAVLKAKKLRDYRESTGTLGYPEPVGAAAAAGGHFVNVIASWAPSAASAGGDSSGTDGESYEVMFTPVPGRERAMAIVHTVAYSSAAAVRETALDKGLLKKYGGFTGSEALPDAPTWRVQSDGEVQVGDACDRRGLFGGLGDMNMGSSTRPNLALKTTPEEFRFQVDRCGAAIVTEDHSTAGAAPRGERLVTRFTVTAYSPAIGFDGATAASQWMQTAGAAANKSHIVRTPDQTAPNL